MSRGSHASNDPTPGMTLGEFLLDARIGHGKFGLVFAATRQSDGKRFALKVLRDALGTDSEAYLRFVKEVQAMARVKHPNIVEVYTIGREGDAVYYPMEYLTGETLAERIKRSPLMTLQEIADVALPVAMALQSIHKAGFVHRDLKPANLFLNAAPGGSVVPKVLDFGIVKDLDPDRKMHETRKDLILGTPIYMSPEQWSDSSDVTARSDQFSFGAILYECFTGQRLFKGNTFEAVAMQVSAGEIPVLRQVAPSVPEMVSDAVQRMLAREPEKRFKSMRDVAAAFRPFASPDVQDDFAGDFDETVPRIFSERALLSTTFEHAMLAPGDRPQPLEPLDDIQAVWEAASKAVPSLPPRRAREPGTAERGLWLLWCVALGALSGALFVGQRARPRGVTAAHAVTAPPRGEPPRAAMPPVIAPPPLPPEVLDAAVASVIDPPDAVAADVVVVDTARDQPSAEVAPPHSPTPQAPRSTGHSGGHGAPRSPFAFPIVR